MEATPNPAAPHPHRSVARIANPRAINAPHNSSNDRTTGNHLKTLRATKNGKTVRARMVTGGVKRINADVNIPKANKNQVR